MVNFLLRLAFSALLALRNVALGGDDTSTNVQKNTKTHGNPATRRRWGRPCSLCALDADIVEVEHGI